MRFDDLEPGMSLSGGRYRVTEAEMLEFARRYDPQWFHLDPVHARDSRWKGLIASGWLTCSIAMRLAVSSVLRESDSIGSPGVEQVRWPAPLRPEDEVELRIKVLERRISRSGGTGIVRWQWWLTTQAGTTVLELIATSLFELRRADATG
jgi:acyl dehydratase